MDGSKHVLLTVKTATSRISKPNSLLQIRTNWIFIQYNNNRISSIGCGAPSISIRASSLKLTFRQPRAAPVKSFRQPQGRSQMLKKPPPPIPSTVSSHWPERQPITAKEKFGRLPLRFAFAMSFIAAHSLITAQEKFGRLPARFPFAMSFIAGGNGPFRGH